jgi:SGNH domain (fused to AT3 domains)
MDDPPSTKSCLLPRSETPTHRDALQTACLQSGSDPRVIIWGDSFADRLSPAINDWARSRSPPLGVEQLTKASCAPLLHVLPLGLFGPDYGCRAFNDLVLERLKRAGGLKQSGVLIVGAWWPRATDWWTSKGLTRETFDLTTMLGNNRVCPARVNGTIAYIDHEHLTTAMAHRLTSSFAPYLDWLVGRDFDDSISSIEPLPRKVAQKPAAVQRPTSKEQR